MKPLKAVSVDDEPPARAEVRRLLGMDARVELVGEGCDGVEALALLEALEPDILLLDIQMPGLNGFEVIEALQTSTHAACTLVFSTAYDAYALRAFEANAVDYLLKPYDAARFERAMNRAVARHLGKAKLGLEGLVHDALQGGGRRVALRSAKGGRVVVEVDEVLRLLAANKTTRVAMRDGTVHEVRHTLGSLTTRLGRGFVRVHRSESVNVRAVITIQPLDHGDAIIMLDGGASSVVSRTYRASLEATIAKLQSGVRHRHPRT